MDELLVEALEEAIGTSTKKWALIVVAVLAGAIVALWLTRRRRQAGPELVAAADAAT